MAKSTNRLVRDTTFEDFLSATVGDDGRGTSVSVLSMLARLGLDPWAEASSLAGMHNAPAHQRLETLMARFEDVPSLTMDRTDLVSALLALLPKRVSIGQRPSQGIATQVAALFAGRSIFWILASVLVLIWLALS